MRHARSWSAGVALAAVFFDPIAVAADCNGNGKEDVDDITLAASEDCNTNQVPDECEYVTLRFGRGDPFVFGATPQDLVAADVNGDGVDDLAVGNRTADGLSSVSIVLSLGDATWAESVEYPAHEGLSSLTAGDFDSDGDLDVATANSTEILVFANAADGSFAEAVSFAVSTSTRFVTTADVSGDGLLDLVVSNRAEDTVSVLPGDGDGTFGVPRVYPVGERPEQVGVADLDGDGAFNVVDAIALLDHIFRRGPALSCAEAGDANADNRLNILDATTLVAQIFHGQAVPAPFPDCGLGADGGDTGLKCASFSGCE